ncbi:MAG TPA: class I SAM-dependent methyltransferase [Bauldia sp.]|nr:class I SAM-dependent methyltransferase [Bauldia sp.]
MTVSKSLDDESFDFSVPQFPRFRWPKSVPPVPPEQQRIADDFMHYWHEVLPRKYGLIERFNHTYPLLSMPVTGRVKTLELGAGLGGHLAYEPLDRQEYHCMELRAAMAAEIRRRYPSAVTVTGDCQHNIPYPDASFDRVIAIHVLEHLPELPGAIGEVYRVLKPDGVFSVVLPCDPGLAYGMARKISAERFFRTRYGIPYGWLIRREHLNSPAEILHVIGQKFGMDRRSYFPFGIPVATINLCIGVTAYKRNPAA